MIIFFTKEMCSKWNDKFSNEEEKLINSFNKLLTLSDYRTYTIFEDRIPF